MYVFNNHADSENALHTLRLSDFDMKHLFLIGRSDHTEGRPIGFYIQGDRIHSWEKFGVFFGAILGLLFTHAIFVLPEV